MVTSAPGVAQVLSLSRLVRRAAHLQRFRFAGSGGTRAIFDNLSFTTAPGQRLTAERPIRTGRHG